MVLANSKTHIEPLDTFHDAGAHDLDILLKGTIVGWPVQPGGLGQDRKHLKWKYNLYKNT